MNRMLWLTCLIASACSAVTGSGVKRSEPRTVAAFSQIDVNDGVTIEITKGPSSVTIEGDDNVVPLYSTTVVGDRLVIRRSGRDQIKRKLKLLVRVTTPTLTAFQASGGVDARLDGVGGPALAVAVSGGVELELRAVELETLELDATGGVNVKAQGTVNSAKVTASGGVDVKAATLEVGRLSVDASGGCSLEVNAKSSVSGALSGGASASVHGHPPQASLSASGGADVHYVD